MKLKFNITLKFKMQLKVLEEQDSFADVVGA